MSDEKIKPLPPPPPPPPPPPESVKPPLKPPVKIEKPEDALAQATFDKGGTLQGPTHQQTIANLSDSRRSAIDQASQQGRTGDINTINRAYDQAQARLDADNVVAQVKPEAPTHSRTTQTADGAAVRESTYADGTRVVHTDGLDANGNALVTTQVFDPKATGPAAAVPLESRSVVDNGVSTVSGLPQRTVQPGPDGKSAVITDAYGGTAADPARIVQHAVIPNEQGYQVQSVTLRDNGADVTGPQPLRIREVSADGATSFDTGEVSKITTTPVAGQPGVSTVTHQYDGGYRMEYQVHAAPAGSQGIADAQLSQKLVAQDGTVVFEQKGVARTEQVGEDGRKQVIDTAANGSRTVYSLGDDGKLATTQAYDAKGALQQTTQHESVSGLPVVTARDTTTNADGSKVVTEYDAQRQPVGVRQTAADGSVVKELGSLKGERIDQGRAGQVADEILDQGDRTMWRDDYEKRLNYALDTLQDLDPVSQQMVLSALQEKDPGMGQSWFKTGILENLSPEQMTQLENGGLDIMTGVPGTKAADLQAIKDIDQYNANGDNYTGEYGELAATSDEQNAGQLQAFMTQYQARAADPAAQARFVALYNRMHGDAFTEGFLSDEHLASARDAGVTTFTAQTVKIDGDTYNTLMGDRLETAADKSPAVLAARDRVMDAGVRRFMVDNQEERVQALVKEMDALDPEDQAALMRQIVKTDPDARLNWLRDSIISRATEGNEAFTPQMRELITDVRGNGETSFMGQLQGFGGGVKDAAVGFVVGLGALARTAYDLSGTGVLVDQISGGNAPAFLPSAKRGMETGEAMVEGLPHMFDHIGKAWSEGRYGEALGNVTFDVASLLIPLKIPKIKLPGAAGAVDDVAHSPLRYIDQQGRPVTPPTVEPRLATQGPDGVYNITDLPPPRGVLDGAPQRLALDAAPTAEVIAQRQATAISFYERVTGKPADLSHVAGIDFTRPVEVRTLPKGTEVYQWQVPGGPKGNYFSFSESARPTDIGIADIGPGPGVYGRVRDIQAQPHVGVDPKYAAEITPDGIVSKVSTRYVLTEDTQVLVSTANRIDDTWAIPDNTLSMPTEGGRLQIYAGKNDPFQPVAKGVDPPDALPPAGATGAYQVPPGRSFSDDMAGTTPHRLDGDLLQVAKHVYKADGSALEGSFRQVADADLPAGFTPADFNHSSGLRAGLYTNGEGQFVLAFKGTAPTSRTALKDIYTDAAQGLGFDTAQYRHAVDLTRRAYETYGENLVLTGHSLGGGLASQAAMAVGGGNLPAIVFNPAAVHPRNLARNNPLFREDGGVQQAPDGGTFANSRDLAPYFAEQGGVVRAYLVKNDELNWLQDHIPGMPDALGHREMLPPKFPVGHTMGPVEESFNKRFPDGVSEIPADVGRWYIDPQTGQWTTKAPDPNASGWPDWPLGGGR